MPTISEPQWLDREERSNRYVDEFVHGTDSVAILRARLIGNGLRGIELEGAINLAIKRRDLLKAQPVQPSKVLVMARDGTHSIIRFRNEYFAGRAVEMLRKLPNVLFATRVIR